MPETHPARPRPSRSTIRKTYRFPARDRAPAFLWRDEAKGVASWRIDISFADGSPAVHATSKGERPRIGPIDPDCVADTNEPPKLNPQMAASHSWVPDRATWAVIKKHSVAGVATVAVAGFRASNPSGAVSRGSARISTSRDPVGAPIFYRDVPLMPSELERGVIKPLAAEAIPLVAWRLRNVAEPASRVVLHDMPVCANCHSFSADGKTLGMDLHGLRNNRGLYIFTRVAPEMRLAKGTWSSGARRGRAQRELRAGFMSQVSPDGRFVVTTINPLQASAPASRPVTITWPISRITAFCKSFIPRAEF